MITPESIRAIACLSNVAPHQTADTICQMFATAFESNQEFREWFSNPMNEMVTGQSEINAPLIRRLHSLLRPFILRRLKKVCYMACLCFEQGVRILSIDQAKRVRFCDVANTIIIASLHRVQNEGDGCVTE